MRIVDAHCHASPYWYEPVEALLHQMDRNQVAQALLVQYHGQYDNAYQFACVRRHPDRLAAVVLVDVAADTALGTLERLAEEGAVGLRLRVDDRSPGDDPLAIWRKAAALGLPVTCTGTKEGFAQEEFAALVAALPQLPIILEHLGSLNHPEEEGPPYPVRSRVFALARYPNVYIKIHGVGEICPRTAEVAGPMPFRRENLQLFHQAHQAFGPARMMWGSDFPPVSGREGYGNAFRWTWEQFSGYSEEDRALIFGETARRLYGLGG